MKNFTLLISAIFVAAMTTVGQSQNADHEVIFDDLSYSQPPTSDLPAPVDGAHDSNCECSDCGSFQSLDANFDSEMTANFEPIPIDAEIDRNVTQVAASIPMSQPNVANTKPKRRLPFNLGDPNIRSGLSALSVVLGIFLLFVVLNRLLMKQKTISHEMIEVLGRTAITPKHNLHLVRVHDRLILLSETPNGLQQLESIPSPSKQRQENIEASIPIKDADADRLLDMIRQSDKWISPTEPPHGRPRDSAYAA